MDEYYEQIIKERNAIFCENIRFLRKKYKLTQAQMAKWCSTSAANIRKIENGTYPKYKNLKISVACCKAFHLSIDRLFNTRLQEIE